LPVAPAACLIAPTCCAQRARSAISV